MIDMFTPLQWAALTGAAFFVGAAKTGIRGSTMLAVPLFAEILGARLSTGVVLFLLVLGDAAAVRHYRRDTQWDAITRLFPWALTGVVLGAVLGSFMSETMFRNIMGIVLLFGSGLLLAGEVRQRPIVITRGSGVGESIGVIGGFSSMIGNVAAPIINLFLLTRLYTKNQFIATSAMFFFLLNVSKIPVHLWYWKSVTWDAFPVIGILTLPLLLGAGGGVFVARLLPERPFRIVVVTLAAIASLRLVFFT